MIDQLIKEIHDSNSYGIYTEVGCGQPLSNLLFGVEGASKTVFFSESPYSKEKQENDYGMVNRSVSSERVLSIINKFINWKLIFESHHKPDYERVNTIFTSSFQILDNNRKSIHGWIAISTGNPPLHHNRNNIKCYHISIHEKMSRKQYIEKIGLISLKLLCLNIGITYDESDFPDINYIDQVYDVSNYTSLHQNLKETIELSTNSEQDCFISINENGNLCRVEDLVRNKEKIIIYKGSFNPPHNYHLQIARTAEAQIGIKPIFMISTHTFGKEPLKIEDILKRISYIKSLGYSLIINNNGYFKNCIEYLRLKFSEEIIFLMGIDTLKRVNPPFYKDFKFFEKCKFLVVDRLGETLSEFKKQLISSSRRHDIFLTETVNAKRLNLEEKKISSSTIRELIDSGKFDELKEYIPENILKIIKDEK